MSNSLAGIVFPNNGVEVFTEDWQNEQSKRSAEMLNRDLDNFGAGIVSGGVVTLGSGNYKVNISALIAYDVDGKRIEMPSQTDYTLPDGTGILAARHKFLETSVLNPGGTTSITYRANSFELVFREAGLQTGDVGLWNITVSAGVVTLNSDVRSWRKVALDKGELDTKINISDIEDSVTSSSATKVLSAKQGKNLDAKIDLKGRILGEVFPVFGNVQQPSATFPALCIAIPDQDLMAANWVDLVPYLYGYKLKYDELAVSPTSQFTIASCSSINDVVTITFNNTTAEKTILRRLHQDAYVHGSITTVGEADADFDNWYSVKTGGSLSNFRTITLVDALRRSSDDAIIVPAGTTALITDLVAGNAGASQIKFTYAGSGTNTGKTESRLCEFYPFRLAGYSDRVRWFSIKGRTLYSASGVDYVGGLRQRNTMQGFRIQYSIYATASQGGSPNLWAGNNTGPNTFVFSMVGDGVNGTPRVTRRTAADSFGSFMYLFGGRYVD